MRASQYKVVTHIRKETKMIIDEINTTMKDTAVERFHFIPNKTLRRLNKIAAKHGMNCLTDDCPILRDGYAAPILMALPGVDTTGWVRCMIPATPDCSIHVFLDIQSDDFSSLPVSTQDVAEKSITSNDDN
jgi:hypothetical protein